MKVYFIAVTQNGFGFDERSEELAVFRALRNGRGTKVVLYAATEDFEISYFDGSIRATRVDEIGRFEVDEEAYEERVVAEDNWNAHLDIIFEREGLNPYMVKCATERTIAEVRSSEGSDG